MDALKNDRGNYPFQIIPATLFVPLAVGLYLVNPVALCAMLSIALVAWITGYEWVHEGADTTVDGL